MKQPLPVIAALLLALAFWTSCAEPTPFGADLLEDQIADFDFQDTFTLRFTLVREDSALTSDLTSTANYFLAGQLNDPFFGMSSAEINALFQTGNFAPGFDESATIDSAFLYLRYDVPGVYGDTMQPQDLRVYRLTEQLRWDENYYSNENLPAGEEIGALLNFLPRPRTAARINPNDSTSARAAFLKIPLTSAFAQELLNIDSAKYSTDTSFWEALKGIKIAVTNNSMPGAMLAFDLNDDNFSFVRLHYNFQSDSTVYARFDYIFQGSSCNKFTNQTHQYAGSAVEPMIGQLVTDRLYLQGMAGLKLKVEVPYAHLLEDIAVNKAELTLTVESLDGDNPTLTPASQLLITENQGDSVNVLISDVFYSIAVSAISGFERFGGRPTKVDGENGVTVERYHLILTSHFQKMIDALPTNEGAKYFYINVYPQSQSAMRSILHGPTSTSYPAKLNLKYTRIK